MRNIPIFLAVLLAACTAGEKEVFMTSVNVDEGDVQALLNDVDGLAGNALPVERLLELALSTPMDEEQQDRFPLEFQGRQEEILFHVWREQVDWVHLYFSSTSEALVDAIEQTNAQYARDDTS